MKNSNLFKSCTPVSLCKCRGDFVEVSIIIGLVLYAICIFLIIKFVKNILVAIGTVILFSVLFIAGTGFFIYGEIMELQQEFPISNNLLLLRDGDTVSAGIVLLPSQEEGLMDNMRILNDSQIMQLSNYLANDNEEAMFDVISSSDFMSAEVIASNEFNDDTFKIVFVEMSVLEEAPVSSIDFSDITGQSPEEALFDPIPMTTIIELFDSDDPWGLMLNYVRSDLQAPDLSELEQMLEEMNLTIIESGYDLDPRADVLDSLRFGLVEQFGNDDIRGFAFLLSLATISTYERSEGVKYLFSKYKDEEIYIRDTSILFDLIRLSPNALIDAVVQETGNVAGEIRERVESEVDDTDVDVEALDDMNESYVQDMETIN